MGTQKTNVYRLVLKKSWVWALFVDFDFLVPKKSVASKPDQKVDPLVGLFGRLAISKSCFLPIAPKLHQSRNSKIEDDS